MLTCQKKTFRDFGFKKNANGGKYRDDQFRARQTLLIKMLKIIAIYWLLPNSSLIKCAQKFNLAQSWNTHSPKQLYNLNQFMHCRYNLFKCSQIRDKENNAN